MSAGCAETRRLTTIVWCCAGLFLLVDVVWLALSPLRFERANWTMVGGIVVVTWLLRAVVVLAPARVGASDRRLRVVLRGLARRCELLCRNGLLLLLIVKLFLVFSYLVTAAALPLQDAWLARIDRSLGFDWPAFLAPPTPARRSRAC